MHTRTQGLANMHWACEAQTLRHTPQSVALCHPPAPKSFLTNEKMAKMAKMPKSRRGEAGEGGEDSEDGEDGEGGEDGEDSEDGILQSHMTDLLLLGPDGPAKIGEVTLMRPFHGNL